jgi:hypothetical protein
VTVAHTSLAGWYRTAFEMRAAAREIGGGFSITEYEGLLPYERELYVTLMTQRAEELRTVTEQSE